MATLQQNMLMQKSMKHFEMLVRYDGVCSLVVYPIFHQTPFRKYDICWNFINNKIYYSIGEIAKCHRKHSSPHTHHILHTIFHIFVYFRKQSAFIYQVSRRMHPTNHGQCEAREESGREVRWGEESRRH